LNKISKKNLAQEVKETASALGANLVGVVPSRSIDSFKPVWVGWKIQEYTQKATEIMPDSKSIIMAGYHVWDDMLELAIRKDQGWLYPGYLPLRTLEQAIANFLEARGYKTAFPRLLSYKRLAQLAGFGNYGKNSLIISREFGPWIRLAAVLTNAEMAPDTPFEDDLCRDCDKCLKACPVGALAPYKVDDSKCLVGVHLLDQKGIGQHELWSKYEPSFTKNSHLMCMECQKACPYGKSTANQHRTCPPIDR